AAGAVASGLEVLHALEEGGDIGPGPARRAGCGPPVVVGEGAAHPHHRVDGTAPSETARGEQRDPASTQTGLRHAEIGPSTTARSAPGAVRRARESRTRLRRAPGRPPAAPPSAGRPRSGVRPAPI